MILVICSQRLGLKFYLQTGATMVSHTSNLSQPTADVALCTDELIDARFARLTGLYFFNLSAELKKPL